MKRLVLILGMHRSGTSVVTKICQSMGAYLGEEDELMIATDDNPDGYFENVEISYINDRVLHACNREWYSLDPVKRDKNSLSVIEAKRELTDKIKKLFEKNDMVAVKDPRIAVLLPLWKEISEELKIKTDYIWIFRNPLEVSESLRKRNGFSQKHSLLLWVHYNLNIIKFLKHRVFLMINYNDLLEDSKVVKSLSDFLCGKSDSDLNEKARDIIKQKYVHSRYSETEIYSMNDNLLSEMYRSFVKAEIRKADISSWEERYMEDIEKIDKVESRYADYTVLQDQEYLKKKEIIIYGAGNYGKHAAKMLRELGVQKFDFCDKDICKHGKYLMGGKILSIEEIGQRENALVVVAVADKEMKKEIEQTVSVFERIEFLSFFTLKKLWEYLAKSYATLHAKADMLSIWYKELEWRSNKLKNTCKYPVLVYQSGKVGSSTVSDSLWKAGIENEHIHRFFYKTDIVGELLLGKENAEFIKNSNYSAFRSPGFIEFVKAEMQCKKFITMVREPIQVDLSTVCHWIGTGTADFYFAERMAEGRSFLQAVTDLMLRIQNRMFQWFEDELRELCGINIFDYSFDRKKGYSIISKNEMKVMILKVEKLSQTTEEIGKFVNHPHFQIQNTNVGSQKEYAYVYKGLKENLKLSEEYVDFYYKDNLYMNYFYTEEEQREFLDKWEQCIEGVNSK